MFKRIRTKAFSPFKPTQTKANKRKKIAQICAHRTKIAQKNH
ncbi:hypothetical protein AC229_1041 [Oenococcus oeni]|nr:hypothetical protein AC229_1041 [Oenococcus oeni]